ncbi:MAG: flagellar filament capping protein FliD [Treponema sp.]|jgi:flagellar hook-associated protein 2|nr:flagellar filament capping protein FliD [Treponema sp.]
MSDIYVPGLKSRFDTNKLVDDLMKVERIPKERSEKNIENLQAQKTYWQELGRRITALRDSARFLYSFQNPFNDRVVNSSDPSVISGASTREAMEQEYTFKVTQVARADRFLSDPLEDSFKIDEGTYTFSVGQDTITFPFRGGSLREFTETLNRRGRDKIGASLIAVQPGKKSLLIESKITGTDNRLVFFDAAETLGVRTGILGEMTDTPAPTASLAAILLKEDTVQVKAGESTVIPLDIGPLASENAFLQFELATELVALEDKPATPPRQGQELADAVRSAEDRMRSTEDRIRSAEDRMRSAEDRIRSAEDRMRSTEDRIRSAEDRIRSAEDRMRSTEDRPAVAESKAAAGTVTEEESETSSAEAGGGIEEEDDISSAEIPGWTPLEPLQQVDNMEALYITFSDGTNQALPPIQDSADFSSYQYRILDIAGDKSIVSLEMVNQNTHRHISIRNIQLVNPDTVDTDVAAGNTGARNPISEAQDAIITMEGIDIRRSTNMIGDLVPGLTITVKTPSDTPVRMAVESNREGIKDSVITLVANYNRLMADINVLTRVDDRIIQELSYLSEAEQEELRKRMGAFAGDSILGQFRSALQRVAATPYPTSAEQDLAMLAQIGISTDVRGSGGSGYDPARLRGYLEIDEKALDAALETKLSAVQQLFGYDSDGDFIVDSGVAYTFETLGRPYTEIGGIIALKTGTIDSRISQENRHIETLDRQLAAKEAALKNQYNQMEGAYNRMERMTTSLDQFGQQNSGGGRR